MNDETQTDDRPAAERVAEILDAIGELALEQGWAREDVAVALAKGAGELAHHSTMTAADLDRTIGALVGMVHHAASGGALPARWGHH